MLILTSVPSENTVRRFSSFYQSDHEFGVEMAVVGMYVFQTLFVSHAVGWQEIAIQVIGQVVLQIQTEHVVIIVQRALHDGSHILGSPGILSNAVECNAVQYHAYDNHHQG